MKARTAVERSARAVLWAFTLATSLYALLCSLEFSWNNLIKDRRYPLWVGAWLEHHAALAAAAAALASLPLSGRRRWIWGALAALCLAPDVKPGLSALGLGPSATTLAFLAWLPYAVWELLLAKRAPALDLEPPGSAQEGLPAAGALSGAFVGAAYAAASPGSSPAAVAWSLLTHAAAGCGLGLLLDAARSIPQRKVQALALPVLPWSLGAALLYALALLPLPFPRLEAAAYAVIVSGTAGLAWLRCAGPARRLGAAPASRLGRLALLCALALAPRAAPWLIGNADWDFLGASVLAMVFWAVSFLFIHGWLARSARTWAWWPLPLVLLVCCLAGQQALARLDPALRLSGVDLRGQVSSLAQADASLLALRRAEAAARPVPDLYGFLQRSTNIPRSAPIAPKKLAVSSRPPGRLEKYPDIFVIVIDSLRRDYLGAYNREVHFTPSLDALAADSLVFRNAFSAYGATGLSEPSIWAGARLPHKQYVLPFSPMNTLEKLVVSEGYRRLITMDVILTALLEPGTPTEKLDEKTVGNYELCGTLDELDGKLASGADKKPVFAYTQPQDIHISVISRDGAKPVSSESYEGYYAPYASRLARMDRCLGRFVDALKKKGLYDDSVIIVTADHGDSLGEGGRWGHAYTIFPEVLRVPLIMKVPERLRKGKVWDLDAPASLVDISPTLYALLGRPPDQKTGPLGRSLLGDDPKSLSASVPETALEVSSYGPVYGLLKERGRWLYIADGVNYQTYLFDLKADPKGRRNLSDPAAEALYDPPLRAAVEELNRFYGFMP